MFIEFILIPLLLNLKKKKSVHNLSRILKSLTLFMDRKVWFPNLARKCISSLFDAGNVMTWFSEVIRVSWYVSHRNDIVNNGLLMYLIAERNTRKLFYSHQFEYKDFVSKVFTRQTLQWTHKKPVIRKARRRRILLSITYNKT